MWPGIYPKLKFYVFSITCIQMFNISFIHNCQNLESIKMSFIRKLINKPSYIQTMGYCSAHTKKWAIKPLKDVEFLRWETLVGCHFQLQGIFLAQGLNLCFFHLMHWQVDFWALIPPGKPKRHGGNLNVYY